MKLSELKALAEKATSGPWRHGISSYHDFVAQNSTDLIICDEGTPDNSRYIAAANPQTVLQLIERNEKLSEFLLHIREEPNGMGKVADELMEEYGIYAWDIADKALSLYGSDVEI